MTLCHRSGHEYSWSVNQLKAVETFCLHLINQLIVSWSSTDCMQLVDRVETCSTLSISWFQRAISWIQLQLIDFNAQLPFNRLNSTDCMQSVDSVNGLLELPPCIQSCILSAASGDVAVQDGYVQPVECMLRLEQEHFGLVVVSLCSAPSFHRAESWRNQAASWPTHKPLFSPCLSLVRSGCVSELACGIEPIYRCSVRAHWMLSVCLALRRGF